MQPKATTEARPSRPPIQQVATGTVAGGVGQGVFTLVIGANPELLWLARGGGGVGGCAGTGAGMTLRLWIRRTRRRPRGASRGAEGLARAGLGPVDAERVADHVADVGRAVAVAVRAGALA